MVVAAVAEEAVPEAVVEARMEAALTDAKYSSYGPPQILGRGFFVRCFAIRRVTTFGGTGVYWNEKGRAFPEWT